MRQGILLISCVVLVALVACQQKQSQPVARQEAPRESLTELDTAPPLEPDPYAGDAYATDTPAHTVSDPVVEDRMAETALEDNTEANEPPREPKRRTHIIRQGDTLYKLAREYYGDGARWKDIWTANRDHLRSPDELEVGLKLIIP